MVLKLFVGSFLGFIFFFHVGCKRPNSADVENPFHDSIIREIHIHKDLRNAGGIVQHLQSRSEMRRYHAALALISVADSAAVPYLDRALKDRSERVRKTAAVALAQTGSLAAEKALLRALKDEMTPPGRIHILEQIGSCASDIGRLFLLQLHVSDSATALGLSKAFYRYVLKNGTSSEILTRLEHLIGQQQQSEGVRFVALALARSASPIPASFESLLTQCYRRFDDSETRRALISSLTKVKEVSDTLFFTHFFPVNERAYLQLSWLAWAAAHPGILGVQEKIDHIWQNPVSWNLQNGLFQTAKAGYALPNDSVLSQFSFPWKLLLNADAPELQVFLLDTRNSAYDQAYCITELGPVAALYEVYLRIFRDEQRDMIVRNAALEQLLSFKYNEFDLLRESLRSEEASFVSMACLSLLKMSIPKEELHWIKDAQLPLLKRFNTPSGWETYLDLQKLGAKISETDNHKIDAPLVPKFGHRDLERLESEYLVEINTTKGKIKFNLTSTLTPYSVLNVLEAIRLDYYSGKRMHRVVPGFVTQGGCQRGDGWGSPDWLQRSEWTPEAFDAGAVGIASAGKDTEGLQLFWMHAHAPHLEGRYSRIGSIIEGYEVLMLLQPGDTILGMKIVSQ